MIYLFDESVRTARVRTQSLGMHLDPEITRGTLHLKQVDPAELSPGELVADIRRAVDEQEARVIVIDSLNGFLHAMPGEADLALQLHELLTYLGQKGVASFLVYTQHGLLGSISSGVDVSYLADSVLVMRYFEARAEVLRAISVLKRRSGKHEHTIRELRLTSAGVEIGEPMLGFRGILGTAPELLEQQDTRLGGDGNDATIE